MYTINFNTSILENPTCNSCPCFSFRTFMTVSALPPDVPPASTGISQPTASLRIGGAVSRGPGISFLVDGQTVEAFAGESVAAAMYACGWRELRQSPRAKLPRGLFCLMGSCQECLVWAGDKKLPSCQVMVTAGLVVETLPFREQQHD
jgi:hypothetical protein